MFLREKEVVSMGELDGGLGEVNVKTAGSDDHLDQQYLNKVYV